MNIWSEQVGKGGCTKVTLYAPYWMVNKTGMPLEYGQVSVCTSEAIVLMV